MMNIKNNNNFFDFTSINDINQYLKIDNNIIPRIKCI